MDMLRIRLTILVYAVLLLSLAASCNRAEVQPTPHNSETQVATPSNQDSEIAQASLATTLLNAIPRPVEDEFDTPDSVVDHLIGAMSDHNLDEYLRCIPIRELVDNQDLHSFLNSIGTFRFPPPYLPDSDFFNLQRALKGPIDTFYLFTLRALWSDQSLDPIGVDPETVEGQENIERIVDALDIARLKELKHREVEFEPRDAESMRPKHSDMGVSEFGVFDATIVLSDSEFKIWGLVGRIDSNWFVLSVHLE